MSFVWKRPEGRLKSPEQCAREILEVAKARGLDEFAAVLATMCVAQESDFWCPWNAKDPSSHTYPFDSESNDGRSVGYFQQQNGRAGDILPTGDRDNWWGSMAQRMDLKRSCNEFLSRLEGNYHNAINDPTLASNRFISNVQNPRRDLRGAYAKHWDRAWQLVRGVSPMNGETDMGFTGDPVWLEDVLRDALGNRLIVEDGWAQRGTGGAMGDIWGVMIHHTGNSRETVGVIRDGRSDLAGPLSQCLIIPDGKCHLVAVGPCNHAGIGDYGPLHDDGNRRLIGFECAWPTIRPDGSYNSAERWPDAQIVTMRDATGAVLKRLGYRGDRVIGHKDYAGARQGKWDPGNLDVVGWFRGEVDKWLDGAFSKPNDPPPPPPPGPILPPDYAKETWDQLRIEWEQLGHRTMVNALGAIGEKLGIDGMFDVKKGQK